MSDVSDVISESLRRYLFSLGFDRVLTCAVSSHAQQTDTGLPPGWEVRHSQSKNLPYYFNAVEKNSRWEPPPGTDTDKLKIYMAKYHSGSLVTEGAQPGKIRAAHLLVKHNESRRPSSWREVSETRVP